MIAEAFAVSVACLAMNVYHEARGQPLEGQVAVAHVTLNRARHTGLTPCQVVIQPKQFSWVNDGKMYYDGKSWKVDPSLWPRNKKAWDEAKLVARAVMLNVVKDPTHGALYYHAEKVHPKWAKKMQFVTKIGSHLFYRQPMLMAVR